jgi:hypothetical protein
MYYLKVVASVISKKINGKIYYYLVVSARVDGKPRIVEQKYLGTAEDIAAALSTCWDCPVVRAWLDRLGRSPMPVSGGRGCARDLVPGGESGVHLAAVVFGAQSVAAGPEVR